MDSHNAAADEPGLVWVMVVSIKGGLLLMSMGSWIIMQGKIC